MKSNPEEILQIENLLVAAFEIGDKPCAETRARFDALNAWRMENEIPMAESCARQVWYGRACDFADFPDMPEIDVLRGAPAYAYMLQVFSEIDNEKEWTRSDIGFGTYKALRESYLRDFPEKAPILEKFHRFLMSDASLMADTIMTEMRPRGHKDLIRNVSGMENKDAVLLIGSLNRFGNDMSDATKEMAMAARKSRRNKASEIIITHPELKIAHAVSKAFFEFRPSLADKSLRVEVLPFANLPLAFEYCDRVLIDLPMDDYPGADRFIMDAWKERERDDNTLTHVRGKPRLRGQATPLWQEFAGAATGVLLPSDIDAHEAELIQHNNEVRGRAKEAFATAASLRAAGTRPNRKLLEMVHANFETPEGPQPEGPGCG